MEGLNQAVKKALKVDRLHLRPHGSPGVWVSFLLPSAVIISSLRTQNTSELHTLNVVYSFSILLNTLLLLFSIYRHQSIVKGFSIINLIPPSVTIFLYMWLLKLDFPRSFFYTFTNHFGHLNGLTFLLKVFPKTFTFGEASVTIQGFSLFVFNLFLKLPNVFISGAPQSEHDTSTVILQLALSWIIAFCAVPYVCPALRQDTPLYIWAFITLGAIYLSVHVVLNQDLVVWILLFLTKPERIGVIILWLICSVTAVVIVQHQITKKKKSNTILRKYFHGLATVVFLSGVFLDVNLIYFSSGCVFCLFFVLEVFRILEIPPLYDFLQGGFSAYYDEKDSGVLALTPICLLAGMSLPLWLHPSKVYSTETHLQLLSGVLSVGIGDTFASVGGKMFGRHKWKGSSKTIEGTVFCILSQIIFIQVLVSFGFLQNSFRLVVKSLTAIFITSIVEAKTDQIDNIVLPLTMYILLMA